MFYACVLFTTVLTSKTYRNKNGKCCKETESINHSQVQNRKRFNSKCPLSTVLHIKLGENIWIIEQRNCSECHIMLIIPFVMGMATQPI